MAANGTRSDPFILGLTGPIACGKTTVGDLLLELGALERIDADRVVHDLMRPGTEVTERVRISFGDDLIAPEGGVDRSRLGRTVFGDRECLLRLEEIVHPAVRREIRTRIEHLAGRPGVVVIDAVKLLQSDLLPLCDAVWVVRCASETQHDRLRTIRGMDEEEVAGRLAAQPPFEHEMVRLVIENSGSEESLREQVLEGWQALIKERSRDQANRKP